MEQGLITEKLKTLYYTIAKAEEKHHQLFVDLALLYTPESEVTTRLQDIISAEAEIVRQLPHRVALH